MSNKKSFLYYSCLSVSEGLDTATNKLQMCLNRFDKDIYNKCSYCSQVFELKKVFEKDKHICNACVKILEEETEISPHIYIICKDNAKYRVFADLERSYADSIFRKEPIIGISGKVSYERLDIHLNSLLNYD